MADIPDPDAVRFLGALIEVQCPCGYITNVPLDATAMAAGGGTYTCKGCRRTHPYALTLTER